MVVVVQSDAENGRDLRDQLKGATESAEVAKCNSPAKPERQRYVHVWRRGDKIRLSWLEWAAGLRLVCRVHESNPIEYSQIRQHCCTTAHPRS